MVSSASEAPAVEPPSPGPLPDRLFATNCYPAHAVRINSYSKPRYLIDILNVLQGTTELERLLASPLGSVFSLPVRRSSMSGQLVHQMLCRQLWTGNSDEIWFLFGGHPIRFSLLEFEDVTGLSCAPYPPEADLVSATSYENGASPYWYKLIGGKLGGVTIKEIVERLKSQPDMPVWRKFQLSLIVLVEGVLLCRTQPLKPSVEVVEMVKNEDFFLNYPWGRHSFERILRMVKLGDYITSKDMLLDKLKQSSLAIHGFPLAIQLLAFKCIPALLAYLPHSDDMSTFLDQIITRLPKCKSFHASNLLDVEYDSDLEVLFPQAVGTRFVPSDDADPLIRNLENIVSSNYKFKINMWSGGDALLPPLRCRWKRKKVSEVPECSSYEVDESARQCKKSRNSKGGRNSGAKYTSQDLQSFKQSLLVEVRELLRRTKQTGGSAGPSYSVSRVSAHLSHEPAQITRSATAGIAAKPALPRSLSHSQHSHTAVGIPHRGKASTSSPKTEEANCSVKPSSSAVANLKQHSNPSLSHEVCSSLLSANNDSPGKLYSTSLEVHPVDATDSHGLQLQVLPGQLFNVEPDCNMGFLLVDSTPHAIASSPNSPCSDNSPAASAANRNCELVKEALSVPSFPSRKLRHPRPPLGKSRSPLHRNLRKRRPAAPIQVASPPQIEVSPQRRKLRSHKQPIINELAGTSTSISNKSVKKESGSNFVRLGALRDTNHSYPAHNLRSKKVCEAVDVKDMGIYILSGLAKKNSRVVSNFLTKLNTSAPSSYELDGHPFPGTFFSDMAKPKNWLTSLHIDLMISFGWKKYGVFLGRRRCTILDSMFTSVIGNKYMSFKEDMKRGQLVWNQLLIQYVRGSVVGRTPSLQWLRDIDIVYMPMNWGKKHWVGLCIDLLDGHISILDPFEYCNSPRKVASFISPFAQILPKLISSVLGDTPTSWPASGFTFARVSGIAQNKRGGDCGALCVKLMELHSHGQYQVLSEISPTQVDNLRLSYAMDLYEEYVGKI